MNPPGRPKGEPRNAKHEGLQDASPSAPRKRAAKKTPAAAPPQAPPADTISQRARAYQGFTQQILSGGIRSGQFVSQRELMALLDMPLGAVREMIPRLEAGGLVKTVPQRGLQIAHVDLKLIRNAFQLRGMIEREAIAHFARSVSQGELDTIEAEHRDILQRASASTVDAALLDDAQALDWGLHDRMVDALGNEIVSEIYRVNTLRVRLIRLEHSVITPAQLIPAMHEHLAFIAALQQRDAIGAVALLEAHIHSARERVMNAPLELAAPAPAASSSSRSSSLSRTSSGPSSSRRSTS